MPVQRYRRVEDMPPVPWCEPGSAEHLRRLAALWQRTSALAPRTLRPGVVRFRSIEETWAASEAEPETGS